MLGMVIKMNKKVDLLQDKKIKLQVELNDLLSLEDKDDDKINEIKSEILYIDKQIEKIVGKNEIESQKKLKKKISNEEEINKKNYYDLKSRVKTINPMLLATNRIIKIISVQYSDEKVKVK